MIYSMEMTRNNAAKLLIDAKRIKSKTSVDDIMILTDNMIKWGQKYQRSQIRNYGQF